MTRPRTPRAASEVANSSPNMPSVHGDVVVTTRMSPGPALLDRRVDHQVVAGPAQHGDRRPAGPRAVLDRAEAGPEVPGPADRLVHGGDAELGELVHDAEVGPGHVGDDDVAHQLSLSVTCGNSRM